MLLLDVWLDAAVQDGFERGRTIYEIAHETGLSVPEVVVREKDLHLIAETTATMILRTLPPNPQA